MNEIEIIQPSALESTIKAECDIQIATAKKFPRVVAKSLDEALMLATVTPEVAEQMTYALPRDGKSIEGPSVRFAEIVAYTWGNIRAAARIIEIGATEIVAQGVCHDLEKNVYSSVEVRRRITNKSGQRFKDDMIAVTGNAACSIAFRNAIFKVIPPSFFVGVIEAAKKKAQEQPIKLRVEKIRKWLEFIKIDDTTALAIVGKKSWAMVTEEDVQTFQGLREAIKEGSTTKDEAFPPVEAARTPKRERKPAEQPDAPIDAEFVAEVVQEEPAPVVVETLEPEAKPEAPARRYATCPVGGRKEGKQMVEEACKASCDEFAGCPAWSEK